MPTPSRMKSCARCRQQKLRCDAYQKPGQPCSRCKRMRLDCVIAGASPNIAKAPTKSALTREIQRLNRQLETTQRASDPEPSAALPIGTSEQNPQTTGPTPSAIQIANTELPIGSTTLRPPPNGHISLPQTREQIGLDYTKVEVCFSIFWTHYSGFLDGIFDPTLNPETYYNLSPFLFWAIVATGARNLRQDSDVFLKAVGEIRDKAFLTLFTITNPIPSIQAALILCLWPVPIDTMWKDPSHGFAGAAYSLAVQHGLHATSHEQDFCRTSTNSNDKERSFRAHLWLHCCMNFQSTSLCDGLPFFSISEPRLSGRNHFLNLITSPSLLFRYRCHQILTNAMSSISGSIDLETQDGSGLISLIKIFGSEVESVSLPADDDLCTLTQFCARLAIMTHGFFIQSYDLKAPILLNVLSISTRILDLISRLDAMQDFSYYATSYYSRMSSLAAFCIIRIIRSRLKEHINLRDAEQSVFKAIAFLKRRSIQRGDLDERYATIITQLWSNSGIVNRREDSVDGLDFRIRSRLFMSVVFDTLWWWRTECNGQSSPYDSTKASNSIDGGGDVTAESLDVPDAAWSSSNMPLAESLEYLSLPLDGLIDWNWPSNVPLALYNTE